MKLTSLFSAVMLSSLVFALSACGGSDKCKKDEECALNQTCNTDTGACEDVVDLCAARTSACPGGMTCDAATGDCTGICCNSATCPDPRTSCDETKCAAGDSTAACVAKVCTDDTTTPNGCKTGFNCSTVTDPPVCNAACITDGCPEVNQNCDAATGECLLRLPMPGEVGSPCTAASDCDPVTGLECFSEADYGITAGYCSRRCASDSECPTGTFCDGICYDACDTQRGDCPVDQQCLSSSSGPNDYCFPIFDQSTCTTGCLANGAPCDTKVPDQCAEGSACVGFGGGAMCMSLSCDLGTDIFGNTVACKPGETCQGLGSSLTGCMNDCDATDVAACSSLSNTNGNAICAPQVQASSNYDTYFFTDDVATCAGTSMPDSLTLDVGDIKAMLCISTCTSSSDCNPGQFCDDAELRFNSGEVATWKTCMNYNIKDSVTCADSPCGTHACQDLNIGGGQTAVICHDSCTADADCTGGFGGCNRLEFLTGDSVNLCLYDTAGAFCFAGCETDKDCGYCQTDADCPLTNVTSSLTRQEKCDVDSNTCVMPVNGVAEVNQYCRGSQIYWANSINTLDANGAPITVGGCATSCGDDLDCGGGSACVADAAAVAPNTGFCSRQATLCNGPTGQCEAASCVAGADCLHGQCQSGSGPLGEARCVAGCSTDVDCGPGVCDTGLGYCTSSQMWNLGLDITGLTSADGVRVYAAVTAAAGASLVVGSATVASGAASFSWADLLPDGGDYNIDFYADDNADSLCVDADDLVYRVSLTAVTADQAATFDASAGTEEPLACGSF